MFWKHIDERATSDGPGARGVSSGIIGGPGHVERTIRTVGQTDTVVRVRQLLYLVQHSFPPELDTKLLG